MIADNLEISKSPTTPLPVTDIVVVVTVSYGCNTFWSEPVFTIWSYWNFFLVYKISMPVMIPSETWETVLKDLYLKNTESRFRHTQDVNSINIQPILFLCLDSCLYWAIGCMHYNFTANACENFSDRIYVIG